MPARKIGKSHLFVTGIVATDKSEGEAAYEGTLEPRFMKLLIFDRDRVLKFEVQPVTIVYTDDSGKKRRYTPDILVTYRDGTKPLLAEIKPRRYLKKNWKELKPKFRAALRHATEMGWRFKIFDETRIVTPYLLNVEFLLRFRRTPENEAHTSVILRTLQRLRESTPADLMSAIAEDETTKAFLLASLWRLVANYSVGADLEEKLTMRSRIWSLT